MNEKLKEAVNNWRTSYVPDAALHVLECAARGEIPGFQLVPVEPTEKMIGAWAELALGRIKNPEANKGLMGSIEENYAAMLTASREEQK